MQFKASVLICAAIIVLGVACHAQSITPEYRADDRRLDKGVNLRYTRISVGDLLEELSRQTGVELSAGSRDGSADAEVFARTSNCRLADVMDGLWSLLSYKRSEYSWVRSGEAGHYSYRLTRPKAAQTLAGRLRNLTQELFEEHAERMLSAAEADPAQREPIVRNMVNDIFGADESLVKGLLASQRAWSGLATFREALSADERLRVLRGQGEITRVPMSRLSDKGREFVLSVWRGFHGFERKADGATEAIPEPTSIYFRADRGIAREVSPTLWIEIERIGAYGYLGGMPLERAVRKRVGDMWPLVDDAPTDALEHRAVAPMPGSAPIKDATVERARAMEARLSQLSDFSGIPILGRLPHDALLDPGLPSDLTVGAYLASLHERTPYMQWKWRHGVLLVDYPAWFQDETELVPHSITVQLRRVAAEHDGYLPLTDVIKTARALTQDQLNRLGDEFATMHSIAYNREILLALFPNDAALAQLKSPDGVRLTESLVAVLKTNVYLRGAFERGRYRSIRLTELEHPDAIPPGKEYLFSLLDTNGRWMPAAGFTISRVGSRDKLSASGR